MNEIIRQDYGNLVVSLIDEESSFALYLKTIEDEKLLGRWQDFHYAIQTYNQTIQAIDLRHE